MSYSHEELSQIWVKGAVIPDYDPNVWRRDVYGSAMRWTDYGNTDSVYGWEVDHIISKDDGGSDELYNLRPMQWKNNRRKGS